MQTYKDILVEAKDEIKVAWKDCKSEVKEIWNEEMSNYHPIEEIKVIWKDAWADYKFTCAQAKAEAELQKHQKAIDTLAIQAQLEIDELKVNHNENFWR